VDERDIARMSRLAPLQVTTIVRGNTALRLTGRPTQDATTDDPATSSDALDHRLAEIDATIH
jgi:hypothetical protein